MDVFLITKVTAQCVVAFAALVGSGVGISIVTEIVKSVKVIPINKGQKARVLAFVAALSAVATVITGYANGNVVPDDVVGAIQSIATFLVVWLSADSTYRTALKE